MEAPATCSNYTNYTLRGSTCGEGRVLVLTGQLPRAPRTRNGEPRMMGGEIRYFSITHYLQYQGDFWSPLYPLTYYGTLMDDEIVTPASGPNKDWYMIAYSRPQGTSSAPEEWRRHFEQVIDRHYAFVDGELGAALDAMGPDDVVMVVSGFGIDPINPLKRLLGRLLGDPDFTGTHERAPEGFLLAYGAGIAPGRHQRGSVVDVAPTLLYLLGLPIGRDIDGYARRGRS